MSKTREALEAAKAVLEKILPDMAYPHGIFSVRDVEQAKKRSDTEIAIQKIESALAKPEQEPVMFCEADFDQVMQERDSYHQAADELAQVISEITGEDVGEHSSANCPWLNALSAGVRFGMLQKTKPIDAALAEPEQEKFEAWAVNQGKYRSLEKYAETGEYVDPFVSILHQGWQAAIASQWQPIETAPKDGRKIIVFYMNRNNLPRTVMASWLSEDQADEIDHDGIGLEAGWYERMDNHDDYSHMAIHEGEPTHWMPLPPPPKE